MFAVIYQGYVKAGQEINYQKAWNKVAKYFVEKRGAIGSCLHRTPDGMWLAYSRWPDKNTKNASWPEKADPSAEIPEEIREAILTIKACLDEERKFPDICMEVVDDLLLKKKLQIRRAKETDMPQLEVLFLIARQQTFTWENPEKFKLADYKNATAGETVFVAEKSGEIVGFISVWDKDIHPFIHHLYIAPCHQRQGIGTLLIKTLFSLLPRPYRLKCILKNQDAIAFYRKNNWVEIDKGIGDDGEYLLLELPSTQNFLNITLVPALIEDISTIQNLGRFYVYEMSRYCGFLPTWETPSNGLFECIDLSSYCEKPDRHAFLVKVDDELAGFVLINKVGSTPDVDWNVGEFFIVSKFQGKGVGRYVSEKIFDKFPGVWETSQIPENTAAIKFWDSTVSRYSNGQFEKTVKTVPNPKPHPMIILKFTSKKNNVD